MLALEAAAGCGRTLLSAARVSARPGAVTPLQRLSAWPGREACGRAGVRPRVSPRRFSSNSCRTPATDTPPFAFAFDIDGVLLHVDEPIPGAAAALRFLHAHGVPFILLTNGGGRHEADRVADLQRRLGLDANPGPGPGLPVLSTANFVQSHTPFQELLDDAAGLDGKVSVGSGGGDGLRDQTVLVTGSNAAQARTIAERYGFRSVVTPADILMANPDIWPFDTLLASVYAKTARPLPRPLLLEGGKRPACQPADLDASRHLRIAAAFVFNDPRDWALDIQLLTDLLQSRQGFLGTFDPAALAPTTTPSALPPRLFFSNGDLLWATTYHLPRFGQGAFAAAVAGVWAQLAHGQALLPSPRATLLGKPNPATYRFAERVLVRHRETLLQQHDPGHHHHAHNPPAPLQTVYMVGDNPESDIAGANQFRSPHGTDWCSVLVGTGVYNGGTAGTAHLRHRPRAVVDNVGAAVRWALQREGWTADF